MGLSEELGGAGVSARLVLRWSASCTALGGWES